MQKRLNAKRANIKRPYTWIVLGEIGLVIIGFFGGEGLYKVTHPRPHAKVAKVASRPRLKTTDFPEEIRGSYVSYFPMRTAGLQRYYQLASLVHITKSRIYQQLLVAQKKQPQRTITKSFKRNGKPIHKTQTMTTQIPLAVRQEIAQTHIQAIFKTMNADAVVSNVKPHDQVYDMTLNQADAYSSYNPTKLNSYFGKSRPYLVPASDYGHVHMLFDGFGFKVHGYQYHQISSQRAKQLLARNGGIASYFDGYQKLR